MSNVRSRCFRLVDGTKTASLGKTQEILVRVKAKSLTHIFEVMNLEGTGLIIGRDFFAACGIEPMGLPCSFPQDDLIK